MLADRYPDDEERGNAMGIALGGLALGVLSNSLILKFKYNLSKFKYNLNSRTSFWFPKWKSVVSRLF